MRYTDKIAACGRIWKLRLTADRVLSVLDLLEEESQPPDVISDAACKALVCGKVPFTMQNEVLQEAFRCAQRGVHTTPQSGPRTLDMDQDWGLIHAAFLQAYGINLDKDLRHLHWRRFLSLLQGVPDGTKLAWVQGIRAAPMPKPTRYNAEERARLAKLKACYAIRPKHTDPETQLQGMYNTLATMAKDSKGR